MPFAFGEEPSNFGDSASVQCSVTSGDLPMNIFWTLNGNEIQGWMKILTSKLGKKSTSLNIDYVEGSHAGNYTCVASNKAATVNFTSQLIVNGYWKIIQL